MRRWIVIGALLGCEVVDPVGTLEHDGSVNEAASDAQPDCSTGQNPCAAVASSQNGCYCGTSNQHAFDTDAANPSCLYHCSSQTVLTTVYCPSGCAVAAVDAADYCNGGGACQ